MSDKNDSKCVICLFGSPFLTYFCPFWKVKFVFEKLLNLSLKSYLTKFKKLHLSLTILYLIKVFSGSFKSSFRLTRPRPTNVRSYFCTTRYVYATTSCMLNTFYICRISLTVKELYNPKILVGYVLLLHITLPQKWKYCLEKIEVFNQMSGKNWPF